jgi:Amt family ammonium transporter
VCGIWGGLATGLLGSLPEEVSRMGFIQTQFIGTAAIVVWALGTSLAMFYALKALGILRVSADEELAGLDISEHGMYAYPPALVTETYGTSVPGYSSHGAGSESLVGKPSAEHA